jgi:hypothetical protein
VRNNANIVSKIHELAVFSVFHRYSMQQLDREHLQSRQITLLRHAVLLFYLTGEDQDLLKPQ